MFCDQTIVRFIAGNGGDGAATFRREKYISRGGPDGGDGGKGGSVILRADENVNTLAELHSKKIYRGKHGGNGMGKNCYGADADDLLIPVPVGTMVFAKNKKELLADLRSHGETFIAARGGKGGLGNTHFKSSIHQTPTFAENGEPGEERELLLELRLIADIGIIGIPSAGKSTLISHISNVKPKIAPYPFTTLTPNLGVVSMKQFGGDSNQTFVAADIPGLIEGAHEGKGLGHEFLRHISRTKMLIHLVDPTQGDVAEQYKAVRNELKLYQKELAKKQELIAINKIDALTDEEISDAKKSLLKKYRPMKEKLYHISAATGKGLKELMFAAWNLLEKELVAEKVEQESETVSILKPAEIGMQRFEVIRSGKTKDQKIFTVTGAKIEQVAKMTDVAHPQGLIRIHHILRRLGIVRELKREGAKRGDLVQIAGKTFTLHV